MSLLGNILWLIFGGFLSGLGYIVGGVLLCITIIGIPFGLQAIRLGVATFAPFGKTVVPAEGQYGFLKIIFDVVWILLFGWEIAVSHLVHAGILAITIIGIPFALQHLKLIPVALFPFGHELR
ncbi:MAG TPA: YccF domain-containing protein [Acidobacteria bacterium]|nr:YccF domain-containing protein [Acidobacteriota bacterium]